MFLDENSFKFVVKSTPLIAIDLLIYNERGEVLLGLRKNSPAKGFWFVPGGRIQKNEFLIHAFRRILNSETGIDLELSPDFFGVYEHHYDDNLWEEKGINTHYVVVACKLQIQESKFQIKSDLQHDHLKFFNPVQLLDDPSVHEFTKNYFRPLNNRINHA